jgi:hypothetical protein
MEVVVIERRIVLLACAVGACIGCAEEPELEPTVAEIIEAEIAGVVLEECGTIETTLASCNQETPPADIAPLLDCITDAWAECRPARLSFESMTIEGYVNPTTWLVLPTAESCELVRYTDWTLDPYGGCKLSRSECAPFDDYQVHGCPWLWPDTCTDEETVLDNSDPSDTTFLSTCK